MAARRSYRNQPSPFPLEMSRHESHPRSRRRSADRAHRRPPAPYAAEVPGMPFPDVSGRWRLAVHALLATSRAREGYGSRQRVDSGHLVVATTGYRPRFLGGA